MQLKLTIVGAAGEMLPSGRLYVETRDVSFEDAPARVLERLQTIVPESTKAFPVDMRIAAPPPDGTILWVHIDADGDGRLSAGDYVTMESYPLSARGPASMTVRVKRIG